MNKPPKDIQELEEKIKKAKSSKPSNDNDEGIKSSASARKGLMIVIEFISGVFVGSTIGYLFDIFFATSPFFLITMMFLGTVAGFLNVYRYVNKKEMENNG